VRTDHHAHPHTTTPTPTPVPHSSTQTQPQKVDDPSLWRACAAILESAGHLPEAADLYKRSGLVEKAATIHIASKNFAAAAPLMAKVTSAKLQLAFGRAKEAQGRWQEAAAAFEAGGRCLGGVGGRWLVEVVAAQQGCQVHLLLPLICNLTPSPNHPPTQTPQATSHQPSASASKSSTPPAARPRWCAGPAPARRPRRLPRWRATAWAQGTGGRRSSFCCWRGRWIRCGRVRVAVGLGVGG